MKIYLVKALICGLSIGLSSSLWAQDTSEPEEEAARAERQARISELRQLVREEREARRQDIEQRLANLSEDERAALQERRRMMRQAQARRLGVRRAQREPCECDAVDEAESAN